MTFNTLVEALKLATVAVNVAVDTLDPCYTV